MMSQGISGWDHQEDSGTMWKFHVKESCCVPEYVRELVEELTKPLPIIYQQSWLSKEVPDNWRVASVNAYLQEVSEVESGKLQACQPDLGAGEAHGDLLEFLSHGTCGRSR